MLYEPKLIQIAAKGDTDSLYALDDDGNVWELIWLAPFGQYKWKFIGSPTAADLKNKQ